MADTDPLPDLRLSGKQAVGNMPGVSRHQYRGAVILGIAASGRGVLYPFPSVHPIDLAVGILGGGALALAKYLRKQDRKTFRTGMEYGSARWGTAEDIAPYTDPDPEQNIILTQSESLTMKPYGKEPKYSRNKNVLVIGGSGRSLKQNLPESAKQSTKRSRNATLLKISKQS